MIYEQDISGCLASEKESRRLSENQFDKELDDSVVAFERLRQAYDKSELPVLRNSSPKSFLKSIRILADEVRSKANHVVILGAGGSSLGGKALVSLKNNLGVGYAHPKIYFFENIDPFSLDELLEHLELVKTVFIVVSKSGRTASTIAQFLACLSALSSLPTKVQLSEHFIVITDPGDNPLRSHAIDLSMNVLDHDPRVGGRFSVLSIVGQLPAMIAGLDCEAILEGAQTVLKSTVSSKHPRDSEVVRGAAVTVALNKRCGITANVMMPYSDRLRSFALWYRQLAAESLGKNGLGITPIDAIGTVDQHSQLQLYLDGPADKMFTLIASDTLGKGRQIDAGSSNEAILRDLHGHTVGDLIAAEYQATACSLLEEGHPVRRFHLSGVTEEVLGALFMHFMLETIVAADLYGVNAYSQPAVEQGKKMALQYLVNL